jgi:hypothetical protein
MTSQRIGQRDARAILDQLGELPRPVRLAICVLFVLKWRSWLLLDRIIKTSGGVK